MNQWTEWVEGFCLRVRHAPGYTQGRSSAASDVYRRQLVSQGRQADERWGRVRDAGGDQLLIGKDPAFLDQPKLIGGSSRHFDDPDAIIVLRREDIVRQLSAVAEGIEHIPQILRQLDIEHIGSTGQIIATKGDSCVTGLAIPEHPFEKD